MVSEAAKFAIPDPTASLESPTFNEKGARLQEIIKDATYNFMTGKIDEKGYQNDVKKWMDQGGNDIIEEYNDAYRASGGK